MESKIYKTNYIINVSFEIGLPDELNDTMKLISVHFKQVNLSIHSLEERLLKALNIQEQIKILQSSKAYIPKEELQLMEEKSKAKTDAARMLQQLIEELKNSKSFLTDEEMKVMEESIVLFQIY
jgi:hypothetical protein